MRLFLLLSLLPILAFAANDHALSNQDAADLVGRLAKSLRRCAQLKTGAETEITLRNETDESLDPALFTDALKAQLPPGAGGPGKKYQISLKIRSTISQTGQVWKGRYELSADVKQGDEALCHKGERLTKKFPK